MNEIQQIQQTIEAQFSGLTLLPEDQPPDLTVQLNWGSDHLHLRFTPDKLTVVNTQSRDFTIYLSNLDTLQNILNGQLPLMDAVLSGDLRSDGYIVWTFRLLMALGPKL